MLKTLESNFIKFKNIYKDLEENSIKELKEEFKFNDDDIDNLIIMYNLKKDIIFKLYKDKVKFEKENQLYNAAKEQMNYSIDLLIKKHIEKHMKKSKIDLFDFKRFKQVLENLVLSAEINKEFKMCDYEVNYVASGEVVFAEHEENYYLIIQKDNKDKEYFITHIFRDDINYNYKLNEQDKILLKEKYNLEI